MSKHEKVVEVDKIKRWLKINQFGKYFLTRELLAWLEKNGRMESEMV